MLAYIACLHALHSRSCESTDSCDQNARLLGLVFLFASCLHASIRPTMGVSFLNMYGWHGYIWLDKGVTELRIAAEYPVNWAGGI